jgi:hypothetical protein
MLGGLFRFGLWRQAALALLLCAAADVLVLDTAFWSPGGSADCCNDSSAADACFCCCRHIVAVRPVSLRPVQVPTAFVEQPAAILESIPAQVLELPPRA